jgi:hypothetical protein
MAWRFATVIYAVLFSCAAIPIAHTCAYPAALSCKNLSCNPALRIPTTPIARSAAPRNGESPQFSIHRAEPISVDGLLIPSGQAYDTPLC